MGNLPALEKNPTATPERPPRGALGRVVRPLKHEDESRLDVVLNHIRENISQRRVLLYPYFKDYDRGQGFNRTVTKSQLSRIMQSLKINILMSDVEKICQNRRIHTTFLQPLFQYSQVVGSRIFPNS